MKNRKKKKNRHRVKQKGLFPVSRQLNDDDEKGLSVELTSCQLVLRTAVITGAIFHNGRCAGHVVFDKNKPSFRLMRRLQKLGVPVRVPRSVEMDMERLGVKFKGSP